MRLAPVGQPRTPASCGLRQRSSLEHQRHVACACGAASSTSDMRLAPAGQPPAFKRHVARVYGSASSISNMRQRPRRSSFSDSGHAALTATAIAACAPAATHRHASCATAATQHHASRASAHQRQHCASAATVLHRQRLCSSSSSMTATAPALRQQPHARDHAIAAAVSAATASALQQHQHFSDSDALQQQPFSDIRAL